jgi:hypothetical protein
MESTDNRLLVSLQDWARKEGLSLNPARAATFLRLALDSTGTDQDHRGVALPSRHRAGGIITPQ